MKRILHSVSYAGFWRGQRQLNLDEFIIKASQLGYDGVEIMAKRPHLSVLDREENVNDLKLLLDEQGLECACLAGYTNFTGGLGHGEVPFIEMQINYVTDLVKIAHKLDCGLIRIFTGYEREDLPYWSQWDICVKAIRECAKRAQDYGVTIGIQNHHDIGVNVDEMVDMILEIDEPNCRAMFDPWAPAVQGDDLEAAVSRIGDLMVYTTAADYVKRPRYKYSTNLVNYEKKTDVLKAVPMGEGFIDYKGFFKALKKAGYDGPVAYEMCSELRGGGSEDNLDRCAKRFLEYMDHIEKTMGGGQRDEA